MREGGHLGRTQEEMKGMVGGLKPWPVVRTKEWGLSAWGGQRHDESSSMEKAAGKQEGVISFCVTVRCAPCLAGTRRMALQGSK